MKRIHRLSPYSDDPSGGDTAKPKMPYRPKQNIAAPAGEMSRCFTCSGRIFIDTDGYGILVDVNLDGTLHRCITATAA